MDKEIAALRAKIQAMKNLAQVQKRYSTYPSSMYTSSYGPRYGKHKFYSQAAKYKRPTNYTISTSTNKVWRNPDAEKQTVKTVVEKPKTMSINLGQTKKSWGKMQWNATYTVPQANGPTNKHVLKLEDGEYAKANGGFSLVRSDFQKLKNVETTGKNKLSSSTRNIMDRGHSIETLYKPKIHRFKSERALATMQRVKANRIRLHLKKRASNVQLRTEYCLFYNRFGHCNNKTNCTYIHDSRKIAVCRKFLKNECHDEKCLLSHQLDKNKMPVCSKFLKGNCLDENCIFLHVKVSSQAAVCEAFLKGYCPKGSSCCLKHELPTRKISCNQNKSITEKLGDSKRLKEVVDKQDADVDCESKVNNGLVKRLSTEVQQPELSLRPKLTFTSKYQSTANSLFEKLKAAKNKK